MILERAAMAWKRGGVAAVVREGRSRGGFAGRSGRERVREEWKSSVILKRARRKRRGEGNIEFSGASSRVEDETKKARVSSRKMSDSPALVPKPSSYAPRPPCLPSNTYQQPTSKPNPSTPLLSSLLLLLRSLLLPPTQPAKSSSRTTPQCHPVLLVPTISSLRLGSVVVAEEERGRDQKERDGGGGSFGRGGR